MSLIETFPKQRKAIAFSIAKMMNENIKRDKAQLSSAQHKKKAQGPASYDNLSERIKIHFHTTVDEQARADTRSRKPAANLWKITAHYAACQVSRGQRCYFLFFRNYVTPCDRTPRGRLCPAVRFDPENKKTLKPQAYNPHWHKSHIQIMHVCTHMSLNEGGLWVSGTHTADNPCKYWHWGRKSHEVHKHNYEQTSFIFNCSFTLTHIFKDGIYNN